MFFKNFSSLDTDADYLFWLTIMGARTAQKVVIIIIIIIHFI